MQFFYPAQRTVSMQFVVMQCVHCVLYTCEREIASLKMASVEPVVAKCKIGIESGLNWVVIQTIYIPYTGLPIHRLDRRDWSISIAQWTFNLVGNFSFALAYSITRYRACATLQSPFICVSRGADKFENSVHSKDGESPESRRSESWLYPCL